MEHEQQNEILAAIQQLDGKFETRFKKLEEDFDNLHQSQIKLEGMRGDMQFIGENVASLVKRFNAWEHGDDDEPSIPARVSALEIRVTRLEKKKSRN